MQSMMLLHIISVQKDHENKDMSHQIFFPLATINESDTSASFLAQLQHAAFEHMENKDIPKRFGKLCQGILVDTGAARGNTAVNLRYLAYCSETFQELHIDTSRSARCHFGICSTASKGVALIYPPIGEMWM